MNTTEKIKRKGLELGYTHVGVTTADDFDDYEKELLSRPDYEKWHKNMSTAARPRSYYPQGKSIICATWGYSSFDYPPEMARSVARVFLCRGWSPEENTAASVREAEFRRYILSLGVGIYSGKERLPLRAACARAGIITYGKNNFAFTREDGSFNVLYAFLVDAELEYDEPTVRRDCPEDCRRCIDACPSGAILKPGRLHPRNCAIYNHRLPVADVPDDLWDKFGSRIYGCDECQLVCPRNQAVLKKATRRNMLLEELKGRFDLEKILLMDGAYYEDAVKSIMYSSTGDVDYLRRNAALALGNSRDPRHISALKEAFKFGNPGLDRVLNWAIEKLSEAP